MRHVPSLLASMLLATIAGCSSNNAAPYPPPIVASDYDQSCAANSDCAGVDNGDLCQCSCGGAAINTKDLPRYEKDANERSSACPSHPLCTGDCIPMRAVCVSNKCSLVPFNAVADAGSD